MRTRAIGIFLIIITWVEWGYSSFPSGTLIATRDGLIPIELLRVGDKILGFNADRSAVDVAVTRIDKHLTDSVFMLYTAKDRFVMASPRQKFLMLKAFPNQMVEISALDFLEAQNITPEYAFLDCDTCCHPVIYKDKMELYTKESRDVTVEVYALEIESPHVYLVSDSSYLYDESKKHNLLITHNGMPALGLGVSLAYGSAPSSLSFAGATASVGSLGVAFGPIGVAIGVVTGLGFLGYQFFKSQDKSQNSFYIERADSCGTGGRDPKDPKKKQQDAAAPSIKSLLRSKKLPTEGKIRYVPPKGLKPTEGLPYEKIGNDRAFIDRFGNKWIKGPSRTIDEPFEWDVQLSNQGKEQLGWASRNGSHINVSLKGRITH